MTARLFIDPGSAGKGNACAAFDDSELAAVWFERVKQFTLGTPPPPPTPNAQRRYDRALAFDEVFVERPEFQGDRTMAARPVDLMAICWEGAMLAGTFAGRDGAPIVALTPRAWKGSEPKPAMHVRLWEVLAAAEHRLLGGNKTRDIVYAAREKGALNRWGRPGASYYPRSFDMHNILDAVAMGCVCLGRLSKAEDLRYG